MGIFRSDYRDVPEMFGDSGRAKWLPGDAVAHDAANARKYKNSGGTAGRKAKKTPKGKGGKAK